MTTIWRYPLRIVDEQMIVTPGEAVCLGVAEHRGELNIWLLIGDTDAEPMEHTVIVKGTGHPIEWKPNLGAGMWHLGTVAMSNGLVWHLFSTTLSKHI